MKKTFFKKDRKAWIRILEVFLSILIVMGSILVLLDRRGPGQDISEEVYEKQRGILNIISKNDVLRTEIITTTSTENNNQVNTAIEPMLPNAWNFTTNICELDLMCENPAGSVIYEEGFEVYSTEVLITSDLENYSPKKLRFFVWVE